MLRPRSRDYAAPSPQAVQRLATRALVLGYLVTLVALAALAPLASTSSDPAIAAAAPIIAGVALGTAVVLGLLLAFVWRRLRRHARDLAEDRSGLQNAYDRARLDSLLDGLTGLGNHRAFQEALDDLISSSRESGSPVSLLMIDVDDLKQVNDRRGHMAGDEVLRAVAQIMRANLRRSDRAFRIGGDEFALLLPDCDPDGAEIVANHLLAAALSGNHGRGGPCSLTIGVTSYPTPSAGRQQMILHADAALYAGKRHGRTLVERFDPERHGVADDSRSLVELAAAVEQVAADGDLLRAVYQPIYSLKSGAIVGYEGLIRVDPSSGFPDPTSLFVAAEATRRTIELDVVAARTVLAGVGVLPPDAYIAINLSPRTLESDAFSPLEVIALARTFDIPSSQLVVELTEREEVEDPAKLKAAIATLRRHEVRVAIDDVGAGNAGLRLLSEVDFDIIKIDLSLVRAGAHHEPSEAVLRALGGVARQRGRTIVAEGIETADMLEAVLELRFDAGQGYLLSRPSSELATGTVDLFELMSGTSPEGEPVSGAA
jgi:diguanylate cyclase (GGDEF)-like protein